jgi:hypothetical protein
LARFLIWQFGEFGIDCQIIKNSPIELNAHAPMVVSIQITQFKVRQYQWRPISPNLILAKVTRSTVIKDTIEITEYL